MYLNLRSHGVVLAIMVLLSACTVQAADDAKTSKARPKTAAVDVAIAKLIPNPIYITPI
ncbi:hypothetical protein [Acaryochloris sp. CCMEE 5410]|uniref:hypothetical protein n=1 Tax=Acaryochloris sp. CCMEE 5410 TaxID=310037 RepID=UPI0002483AEE|nr:hypothetical protein [Acaryochloris sp. CCMEE 5410]KAI9132793.1 hypothetical protein ON05_005170 [Acaryochloris sp. CCMEE 5410]